MLVPTTIAGSLPKPEWLAPAHQALGAVAARRRAAGRGQARRGAARVVRPGTRGHRHRHRRRADPPPLRHDADREPRGRRLPAQEDGAHPQPLRRRRPGRRRTRSRARIRSTSTTRASCAAQTTRRVKFTLPGPMTMVDTLYDDHYRSREKLAWAFAGNPERGSARASRPTGVDVIQFDEPAFNVYFDEVRDWGIAALERAAQGLKCDDRGPHLLRLRHQGQHRLEEDPGLGVAAVRADLSVAGAVLDRARFRSNAPTRTSRSSSSACLPGRTCWSGPSTWRPTRVETPEDVAATDARGACTSFPPTVSMPAPTAAWCRCRASVARAKLDALAAGAALVRSELSS